jgi:hypothetical protein
MEGAQGAVKSATKFVSGSVVASTKISAAISLLRKRRSYRQREDPSWGPARPPDRLTIINDATCRDEGASHVHSSHAHAIGPSCRNARGRRRREGHEAAISRLIKEEMTMTARPNISMARTMLSAGALALAAVTSALPVGAKPKQTPYEECVANCYRGDAVCFEQCRFWFGTTTKKAAVSKARRPVAGTRAPARLTRLHHR